MSVCFCGVTIITTSFFLSWSRCKVVLNDICIVHEIYNIYNTVYPQIIVEGFQHMKKYSVIPMISLFVIL
jgi:hypothetical protein